ncbi:hypothetical protein T492DRAFT_861112 [Pavlovales sp. CCMP2436]|nr:hypothetical protein T492DRAFT_861112 [Pavlovales sp. CCMP2436]
MYQRKQALKPSKQPRGRPPMGKIWDAAAGSWERDPAHVPKPKAAKAKESPRKKNLEPGHSPQPRGRPILGKVWNAATAAWDDDPSYVAPDVANKESKATTKKPEAPKPPMAADDEEEPHEELLELFSPAPKPALEDVEEDATEAAELLELFSPAPKPALEDVEEDATEAVVELAGPTPAKRTRYDAELTTEAEVMS